MTATSETDRSQILYASVSCFGYSFIPGEAQENKQEYLINSHRIENTFDAYLWWHTVFPTDFNSSYKTVGLTNNRPLFITSLRFVAVKLQKISTKHSKFTLLKKCRKIQNCVAGKTNHLISCIHFSTTTLPPMFSKHHQDIGPCSI